MGPTPDVPCTQPWETTVWWNIYPLTLGFTKLEVLEDPCGANTETALCTTVWNIFQLASGIPTVKTIFETYAEPMRKVPHTQLCTRVCSNPQPTNLLVHKVGPVWKPMRHLQGKRLALKYGKQQHFGEPSFKKHSVSLIWTGWKTYASNYERSAISSTLWDNTVVKPSFNYHLMSLICKC